MRRSFLEGSWAARELRTERSGGGKRQQPRPPQVLRQTLLLSALAAASAQGQRRAAASSAEAPLMTALSESPLAEMIPLVPGRSLGARLAVALVRSEQQGSQALRSGEEGLAPAESAMTEGVSRVASTARQPGR